MLTIRLQRIGKRKNPTYRLIVSEKARDTQYNSLEILGNYNPTQNPKVSKLLYCVSLCFSEIMKR